MAPTMAVATEALRLEVGPLRYVSAVKLRSGDFIDPFIESGSSPMKFSRTVSDPKAPTKNIEVDRGKRKRPKSWLAHANISPQDRAHLYVMHEERKLAQTRAVPRIWRTQTPGLDERIMPTALDAPWGRNGSWHVFTGPLGGLYAEPSYHLRLPQLRPAKLGKAFVEDQGFAVVNTKGGKGLLDMEPGQDACSVSLLSSGWEVLCLMDGHGIGGDWPAARGVRTLPWFLETNSSCASMLKHLQVSAALHHAFERVHGDLVRESLARDVDLEVTGCTAVCVMYHPKYDTLWVANLGDSRAVLLVLGKGAVAQTVDHKFSIQAEVDRLEANGCEIFRRTHEDGFVEERVNVVGCDWPGLCMSRSFGDFCVEDHGVIHDPEVVRWDLSCASYKDRCYVLVASDGVWEVMSTDEASEIVSRALAEGASCDAAATMLVQHSRALWMKTVDGYCDDITVLLVPIVRAARRGEVPCATSCCSAGLSRLIAAAASPWRAAG